MWVSDEELSDARDVVLAVSLLFGEGIRVAGHLRGSCGRVHALCAAGDVAEVFLHEGDREVGRNDRDAMRAAIRAS